MVEKFSTNVKLWFPYNLPNRVRAGKRTPRGRGRQPVHERSKEGRSCQHETKAPLDDATHPFHSFSTFALHHATRVFILPDTYVPIPPSKARARTTNARRNASPTLHQRISNRWDEETLGNNCGMDRMKTSHFRSVDRLRPTVVLDVGCCSLFVLAWIVSTLVEEFGT